MGKEFEDYFSELQVDIISHCMEYADDRAEKVYVYCSCENNMISCSFFYKLNNKIVLKSRLNDVIDGPDEFDVSVKKQNEVIKGIISDINSIRELCVGDGRDMPTEIKLTYDAVDSKVNAEYSYEKQFSDVENKTAKDVFDAWFNEELNKDLNKDKEVEN